jgi:hypothetical protein
MLSGLAAIPCDYRTVRRFTMLFRLWFYICKFAILGFLCLFIGAVNIIPGSHLLFAVGEWIVVPICITSAILAVPLLLGWKTACPFCGERCRWGTYGKDMAMECSRCGLVHGHPLKHWRLCVEKADSEVERNDNNTETT